MYSIIQQYTEIIEAIKQDNPLPVISYLQGMSHQSVAQCDIGTTIIFDEIIKHDKTALFSAMLKKEPDLFSISSPHGTDIGNAFQVITKAIINHEHTEIICCILSDKDIFCKYSNNFFISAVLAENFPVIEHIKAMSYSTNDNFILPAELIGELIEHKKYDMIDYLTDKGKKLSELDVCKTIILGFKCDSMKKYLSFLAETYMDGYCGYEDKEQALMDFITSHTDITDTIKEALNNSNSMHTFDREDSSDFFEFISSFGVKLDDIDYILRYVSTINSFYSSGNKAQISITDMRILIGQNSRISLSAVLHHAQLLNMTPEWLLDLLFSKSDSKHTLILDRIHADEKISYDMFRSFLKYCDIKIDGAVKDNCVIKSLIERNNLPIMMFLVKESVFSDDDIEDIKVLCVENKKERMLSSVDKWYAETKQAQ